MKGELLSRVRLPATPWTAAYQTPLSMGFSRQEYWSRVPLPSPKNAPTFPEIGGKLVGADIRIRIRGWVAIGAVISILETTRLWGTNTNHIHRNSLYSPKYLVGFCFSEYGIYLPGGSVSRVCLQCRRPRFHPWVVKIPWRRKWLPTPIFLPGKFHGQRGLESYSPWVHKEWT